MGFTDFTPYSSDGEYWFSHGYYIQVPDGTGNINIRTYEFDTIHEVHEWCQEYSKKTGCKEIRVEHIIHWEGEEEE